jgi:hypothetical protein
MHSISIVLVVVIASIGQQQLQFVNAALPLPYAGSLCKCSRDFCNFKYIFLLFQSQTIVAKQILPLIF